jgi:hypothetical protein
MQTTTRGDAQSVPPKPYGDVLAKLLVAAFILIPLAAMLFPELNHRLGSDASPRKQTAPAARPSVADPLSTPFSLSRSDR